MGEATTEPVIDLPKGGGALAGLGETFVPDPHTGTGNFTIPLHLPAGRGGFQPSLTLSYSTGNGNGVFGLGWTLPLPGVRRRVTRGVPRYDDLRDTFLLAGTEELVRVAGGYPGTAVYRPRTEGLFARIEHVHGDGQDYWLVRTTDGRTSWYGTPRPAGAPPGWTDPAVVRNTRTSRGAPFEWLLTRTLDPFGNAIRFSYVRDTGTDGPHRWDQPLLTEVAYADHGDRDHPDFAVRVLLTYEPRPDPFSQYRAGFELRTTRRCAAIRVETRTDAVRPVREYRLGYRTDAVNGVSLLQRVQLAGFDDAGAAVLDLPALELDYTAFQPAGRRFTPAGGDQLPAGALRGDGVALVDLFGGGLPDVVDLHEPVRYWRNLGDGRFDRPRTMADAPTALAAGTSGVTLLDADGDGRADLLVSRPGLHGVFPLRFGGGWDRRSFRAHLLAPSFGLDDPEVKLVDLDGDGVTDAIRSGSRMECFLNSATRGWYDVRSVERRAAAAFPDVRFSDDRVRLADMTGDGLKDVVLLHDRNVEYWPSLGRGDWGDRISMASAPALPAGYDPRRVHLADLDGDGAADLVYVDAGRVLVWFNQGGNRWSADPVVVTGTPSLTDPGAVRVADLLGNGTDQLVWSVDAGRRGKQRLWLLELTGGTKPFLLNRMNNGIGAVTHLTYASSTSFYLADRTDPRTRWRTPLPIPVQVVANVEATDAITGGRRVTAYRYHHGYWDGAERELRGFGLVDQLDTDTAAAGDTPPLLTRTWFHQGAVGDDTDGWAEWDGSAEHWPGDPDLLGHRAAVAAFTAALPVTTATRAARRHALRALRGRVLRTEQYGLDGSPRQERPYTVTEHAYGVALVTETAGGESQLVHRPTAVHLPAFPDGDPRRPVFATFEVAARTTRWERGDDPMTGFAFSAAHDAFARPLRRTEVACPRGWRAMADSAEGAVASRALVAYARPGPGQTRIMDRVARTTSFAVMSGDRPVAGPGATVPGLRDLPDEDPALELTGQTVNHYDGNSFDGLPAEQLGGFGALVRTQRLVLTEAIAARAYGDELPPYLAPTGPVPWTGEYPAGFRAALPTRVGYTWQDGDGDGRGVAGTARGWFAQTLRRRYDWHDPGVMPRGLVVATRPPLGGAGDRDTAVGYDAYGLFPATVTDPHGLVTTAAHDYRAWKPAISTDPNGTVMRFAFTPFGQLAASWTTGTRGDGDQAASGVAVSYDLRAFADRGEPISAHTVRRVHADGDAGVPPGRRDDTVETRQYSDGFGRLLQTRTRAEDTRFGDHFGGGVVPLDQAVHPAEITGRTRAPGDPVNVVVSGWQTYDAKGRPVERFEPFFDRGWVYAAPTAEQRRTAVRLTYDPRGTVVRTTSPSGAEQTVLYGTPAALDQPDTVEPSPWVAFTYDPNDNAARTHGAVAPVPAHHLDTPASVRFDPAGRVAETIARNRIPGGPLVEQHTVQSYDVTGNPDELTDALGRPAMRTVHDLAGRPLRCDSIDAGTATRVLDAAGNPVETRDGRGALVLRATDRAGRPSALWARDEGGQPVTLRERLAYGDGGDPAQPAAERAANRAAYRLGKLATQHDAAGRADFAVYDHRGNPIGKTRRVVTDDAVAAGWVANWDAPGAEDALEPAAHTWDASYDRLDRMITIRLPEDADGGRRQLRSEYDAAGGLRRITLDAQAYVEHIARDARGRRTLVVYGNGIVEASAYDPHTFRLRRMWSGPATGPADNPRWMPAGPGKQVRDTAYTHDLVGNTIAVAERAPGAGVGVTPHALDRAMEYDACYQLLRSTGRECDTPPPRPPWSPEPGCTDPTATRPYHETYDYDLASNLIKVSHTTADGGFTRTLGPEPGSNRLARAQTGASRVDYAYDAVGNMVRETTSRHFTWDYAGRLRGYRTQPGDGPASVQVSYLYDAAGRRVKRLVRKQAGPAESTVTIDGGFEAHRHGATASTTLHVTDDQRRVATVRVGPALPGDGAADVPVAYHLGDHLDSSTIVVGGASAAAAGSVRREEYGAWGETTFGSYARKRYRFVGKERDDASGLYAMGARQYAPWLGRWLSPDPAGPVDGPNLYAYARNNPTSRVDPGGSQSEYRDAGAGDVSGAGAQQPTVPASTQDTAAPPTENTSVGPPLPTGNVKGLPPPPLQSPPSPPPPPDWSTTEANVQVTGGYGFIGLATDDRGAATEALAIGGYDTRRGGYAGTLVGGGVAAEHHPGLANPHGVEKSAGMVAHERLYMFRTGHTETETLYMAEVETPKIGRVEPGIGGFVNKADPREIGVFGSGTIGPVTVGGGVTLHVRKDYEQEMRENLAQQDITLVRAPEGTPKPVSPYSLKAKLESWLRLIGIDEQWRDRQLQQQQRVFERQGISVKIVPAH
jgi:RHS repeat-associated protein